MTLNHALFFVLFLCVFLLVPPAIADTAMSVEEWKVMFLRTSENQRKGERTLQDYDELVSRCPEGVSGAQLATCYYQLARKFDDLLARKKYLLKAIDLASNAEEKPAQLIDVFCEMSLTCQKLNENSVAEHYAKLGCDYARAVYGKNLRSAGALVDYAAAAALNKEFEFSQQIIRQIDDMRVNASLDERRDYEARLLLDLAYSFQLRKEYSDAEKYYKQAIASSESLWYPLCGWCLDSFFELMAVLDAQGKFDESHRYFLRAVNIQKTGLDPEGKDVCKYWNGQKAPYVSHVTFTTFEFLTTKELQARRPKPMDLGASGKDPLLVYRKYKARIERRMRLQSHY